MAKNWRNLKSHQVFENFVIGCQNRDQIYDLRIYFGFRKWPPAFAFSDKKKRDKLELLQYFSFVFFSFFFDFSPFFNEFVARTEVYLPLMVGPKIFFWLFVWGRKKTGPKQRQCEYPPELNFFLAFFLTFFLSFFFEILNWINIDNWFSVWTWRSSNNGATLGWSHVCHFHPSHRFTLISRTTFQVNFFLEFRFPGKCFLFGKLKRSYD